MLSGCFGDLSPELTITGEGTDLFENAGSWRQRGPWEFEVKQPEEVFAIKFECIRESQISSLRKESVDLTLDDVTIELI